MLWLIWFESKPLHWPHTGFATIFEVGQLFSFSRGNRPDSSLLFTDISDLLADAASQYCHAQHQSNSTEQVWPTARIQEP